MAATADSSSNRHPAGATAVHGDSGNSPQHLRSNFPSPWAQVVRGEQESMSTLHHSPSSSSSSLSSLATSVQEQNSFPDSFPSQAAHSSPPPLPHGNFARGETSDASDVNAAAQSTKPVWNKPSNGNDGVSPVMGEVSWPALSESTKFSSKFQSESSLMVCSDGSNSSSQEPAIPLLPQKHATTNAKPNSTSNHTMPVRQRYNNKRGNNNNHSSSIGGGPPRGGFIRPSQTPPPPSFPVYQVPPNAYANLMPPIADSSLPDSSFLNNNWDTRPVGGFISQQNRVNEHRAWRANFNPNIRVDGVYQQSRARPYEERGNYGNARDVHMQQQQQQQRPHPRSFMAHPSSYGASAPFLSPQPMRAFGNHMGYQEFYYLHPMPFERFPMEHYRGPQFLPQLPTIQSHTRPPLPTLLIDQIDYYFCDDNLVKDPFLRSNMDDEGWVSIDVIANFPRVKNLTGDFGLILDSMKSSTVVEVQDNKLRRRDDWVKWIPSQNQMAMDSQSITQSNQDAMTTFKNLKIEEAGSNRSSRNVKGGDSSVGDSAGEVRELPNGEVAQNTNSSN